MVFLSASASVAQCKKKNVNKAIEEGNQFYNRQDFQNALALFKRATELEPGCSGAFFNKGQVERQAEQLDQAIISLNKALALGLGKKEKVTAYNSLGFIYLNLKKKQLALEQFNELVKIDSKKAEELKNVINTSKR